MAYLFAVGFVSILGQVVLLRELNVAFYGVELIYTIALGIWLLFSACGTMIGRRIAKPSFTQINILFLILSLSLPLNVAFIRSARLILSDVTGSYLPLHTQFVFLAASLLPIGLLLGLLFQFTARIYIANKRSLAFAYAIESMGGLAGGVCATLFLKLGLQNLSIVLLCALLALGSSFLNTEANRMKWLRLISLTASAALILFFWKATALDRTMTSWTHPNLVETKDSPYSRITVTLLHGQVSVFENDALLFETEGTQAEEFVHVAALQHAKPGRILILGGGIEGNVREALQHSPQIVDYVELNPALLEIVPRNLPQTLQESLRAENVRVIAEDPRQFLSRAPNYDLILVGMPEPTSGQANRFYTQEFFRQCSAKLNKQGIVAFRLQSSENIWTPQLTRRMVSIYRAAKSVFPKILFIPGSTNVVIASAGPLTRDASVLASRLDARGIKANLISPGYLRYLYNNDRFSEVARTLQSGTAPINTDVRPICYQYTSMIWLSKFIPAMRFQDFSLPEFWKNASLAWLLAFILPVLLLNRAPWSVRRVFLTGIAAFAGMVLETVLLLHYQTKNGVLYQNIGILLTGFMAGLALGALVVAKMNWLLSKWMGIALLSGFFLLSATIGRRFGSALGMGLVETSLWLVLSGFFVAGVFAYAGLRFPGDQEKAVAPLYASDLIGGCLGSILASLILAPIAGLSMSAYLVAPIAILSILLL
jgi:spermidine synthase